ncbi:MAG: cell division protein FtsQ/DivIB [Pseudomonadota bacterium]
MRRFFHRAEARVETLPPFFTAVAAAGILGSFVLYGMVLGGHFTKAVATSTAMAGFDVKAVTISGHTYMREQDILDVLGLEPGLSLVTFDVAAAHRTLLREPWVAFASVRKIYPGKLKIDLTERVPFALWQRGSRVSVVDRQGEALADYDETLFASLPLLVGHGAQRKGEAFLATLAQFPMVKARVRASLLRFDRRWDLLLDNDITVKLPEDDVDEALSRLVALDEENDLLSKDIVSVDMRLGDRVVMRLSDEAMVNRRATLKRRADARKTERKI